MPARKKQTTAKKKEAKAPEKDKTPAAKGAAAKTKRSAKPTNSPSRPPKLSSKQKRHRFYIVGIGASAVGREAFERFFAHMPAKTALAFVLAPHLDPTHVCILPEPVQSYTKMEVVHASDGVEVRPNRVYVIEPNMDHYKEVGFLKEVCNATSQGIEFGV